MQDQLFAFLELLQLFLNAVIKTKPDLSTGLF